MKKSKKRADDFIDKHRKCIIIDEQVDDANVSVTSDEYDSGMDVMDPDLTVTTDSETLDNKHHKKQMRQELPNGSLNVRQI